VRRWFKVSEPSAETGLLIRPMNPNDAEQVSVLAAQLGYRRTVTAVRDWVESSPASGDRAAFVACFDTQVVGWVEVSIQRRLQSEPFALIGGLVVRQDMRSRGIGHRLCQQAEQWGLSRKMRRVRVTSRSSRTEAHRFYLRSGYTETKTSLVFEKTLGC
jgi:GNAT superfamily N-acetyltransferase